MGIRHLEAAILASARIILCNKALRQKDILEWTTGTIEPRDSEVVIVLDDPAGISVAVATGHDKRKRAAGGS